MKSELGTADMGFESILTRTVTAVTKNNYFNKSKITVIKIFTKYLF